MKMVARCALPGPPRPSLPSASASSSIGITKIHSDRKFRAVGQFSNKRDYHSKPKRRNLRTKMYIYTMHTHTCNYEQVNPSAFWNMYIYAHMHIHINMYMVMVMCMNIKALCPWEAFWFFPGPLQTSFYCSGQEPPTLSASDFLCLGFSLLVQYFAGVGCY